MRTAIDNVQEDMNERRPDLVNVKTSLRQLADVGRHVQEESRPQALPAANVEGLGRLMYTNHLLPVEIGGTLLLVATIGAIAITHRRPERLPA
jgi:NADH:ubiquinone oxidoreductase subunit 6 (subunit J)